ncbi:MAG TPA: sigma 54-interacting transcriptional regulator [Polyangia bacterium]|nr:sigma 54-interacting transcriptional regulator [Polyangia bacterium]
MALETTTPDAALGRPGAPAAGLALRWVFPSSDGSITALAGVTTFGRDPECAGYLPSSSVSRKHAEIRWDPGSVPMLRDLGSTNGVFLNTRVVKQAPLKLRDVLRFGDWIGVLVPLPRTGATGWTFEEVTPGFWAGPELLRALAPARAAAQANLSVIIQGETGAGKEGTARAIHEWSGRSGPFVAINSATLTESLAEALLFGHRKGAFTGADSAQPGFLRAARGGTLFFDEIVDLPLTIQAKLLRAIEQREVIPVGETTPVAIDVRVLAATAIPLREAVAAKRFRADLLARLEGLTVVLPPLRDRIEDIPFLFAKLIEQERGAAALPRFDPLLIERLCTNDWPFNVRGLAQLARRLLALHPNAAVLDYDALPAELHAVGHRAPTPATGVAVAPEDGGPDAEAEIDPAAFLAALRDNRGNMKRTAAALGISRGRAYRLLEKHGSVDLEDLRQGEPPARS